MREVMRVANQFENWACRNVNFDEFNEVWPYFSLYGVDGDGLLEHIADGKNYAEILRLARNLAPGIAFPASPTFTTERADLAG